jgi:uncharacterized membrane protein
MRNFVTVVFEDTGKAYKGLHSLWRLDEAGEITVHGTAVVHRDDAGRFEVDSKETHPVFATTVGVGIGALLGALAGPAGVAIGVAGGAAIGGATGAVIGGAVDLERSETRQQAEVEAGFVLGRGQSAVIADVSEDSTSAIDTPMRSLGGTVHRRAKTSLKDDAALDDGFYPYDDYLYPYEYIPSRYSPYYGW